MVVEDADHMDAAMDADPAAADALNSQKAFYLFFFLLDFFLEDFFAVDFEAAEPLAGILRV